MSAVPSVLGLLEADALRRLEAAGYSAETKVSGRRREGRPRVIRQKMIDDGVELVVSYFKELTLPLSPSGWSHPADAARPCNQGDIPL